jgi:tripeptide aminopeptidase
MLIANDFITALPLTKHLRQQKDMKVLSCAPPTGSIEETVVELIIRDHNKIKSRKRKESRKDCPQNQ